MEENLKKQKFEYFSIRKKNSTERVFSAQD